METGNTSLYSRYEDFKVHYKPEYKTVSWKDKTIKITTYLPIEQKIDLIVAAIHKAQESQIIDPIKLKMFYELNLVYMYTDVVFSKKDREDEYALYDALTNSGFLSTVIKTIPASEITLLSKMLNEEKEAVIAFRTSSVGIVNTILDTISAKLPAIIEKLSTIDPKQVQKLMTLLTNNTK